MKKYLVTQEADYVQGHLRFGHREGIIEAESAEEALRKVKDEGYDDCLDLVVDSYEVDDVDYGDNEFCVERMEEE